MLISPKHVQILVRGATFEILQILQDKNPGIRGTNMSSAFLFSFQSCGGSKIRTQTKGSNGLTNKVLDHQREKQTSLHEDVTIRSFPLLLLGIDH